MTSNLKKALIALALVAVPVTASAQTSDTSTTTGTTTTGTTTGTDTSNVQNNAVTTPTENDGIPGNEPAPANRGFPWGLLGLIGLAGLAGRGNQRTEVRLGGPTEGPRPS
ncbi:hypothetical protein E5F05_06610 [Deinococcus metallilatus]|uniref:MYXO-CTERM sorting domain-containing protein n=1 Tax=Deinococcus metallilatus TaxID=1211322 RepID=A0AAJ5F8A0_9DEIO|nr:WGxxGxxG-CTERM domain-containing protein [Deinococcus metallilatus]MBB5294618.1 hypothetical protein [Deinococcus metallilatus]QBY07656.1 hypothetical protein E5F05_06610 [Deinococcus metallilatus]RXJ14072.1 hypothetical protein ERJ73_05445 [Deinococcus metallilatus]TLK30037.1 hypothetical protein FCS05_05760 [Deinococcus metallilatus]GMA15831.1 hypothetical protein GCM10025871_21620 [Deinococcus metallilatus]